MSCTSSPRSCSTPCIAWMGDLLPLVCTCAQPHAGSRGGSGRWRPHRGGKSPGNEQGRWHDGGPTATLVPGRGGGVAAARDDSSGCCACGTLPAAPTLTSIWYSSGCGTRYPAKTTALSRCSCLRVRERRQHVLCRVPGPGRQQRRIGRAPGACCGAHMRTRFPMVWSSLCTTKVPAFATLVSTLNSTLQEEALVSKTGGGGGGSGRALDSLPQVVRHDELLLPVGRVHPPAPAVSQPAARDDGPLRLALQADSWPDWINLSSSTRCMR